MKEYPHIDTVFKRNMEVKGHPIIEDDWSQPEFMYLRNNQWHWTEKVDGTNIRVIYQNHIPDGGGTLEFKGKTDAAQIPPFLMKKLKDMFSTEQLHAVFPGNTMGWVGQTITLYGEGYGARIQKGGGNYIPNGVDFILFDVKVGDWWLKDEDMRDVADKLGIRAVPEVGRGTLYEAIEDVRRGFPSFIAAGGILAEGLVCRPLVDLKNRRGDRIVAKIKHRDFARE